MNDTSPEIARMVRERLLARKPDERFLMGSQMFDAAIAMIEASLPRDLAPRERRERLLKRIYGAQAACLLGR